MFHQLLRNYVKHWKLWTGGINEHLIIACARLSVHGDNQKSRRVRWESLGDGGSLQR